MKFTNLFFAAALALAAPALANATTIDFDLRSSGGDVTANTGNSVTAVNGGITLHIQATAWSGGLGGTGYWADATAWGNGIGIQTRSFKQHDQHFADGFFDEYFLLTFSEAVDLASLTFSYANSGDDWRVLSGNFGGYTFQDSGTLSGNNPHGNSVQTALVDSGAIGTQFLVGTTYNHSEWKLHGLSVELAPVPLPAAGWLLLAGVGGLAAMRRRRRNAA